MAETCPECGCLLRPELPLPKAYEFRAYGTMGSTPMGILVFPAGGGMDWDVPAELGRVLKISIRPLEK